MREIKFRVWDGDRVHIVDLYWFEEGGVREWPVKSFSSEYEDIVLMQYTGLKDKNGVEIYEGDVVRNLSTTKQQQYRKRVVTWAQYSRRGVGFNVGATYGGAVTLEVIGNIYENPELVK